MRILAIDTSSLVASVAILDDDIMTAEYTVNFKKTHSQTLLPMIDEIMSMTGVDVDTLDAIAVSGGPGSFTGLRIGSATAKGMGLALDVPIVNVPTVDAMAYNFVGNNKLICPIMDARRNQVYTGVYTFVGEKFTIEKEQCAISIEELVELLNSMEGEVLFTGDGIPVFKDYINENLKNLHYFSPAHLNRQRAGAVGALGIIYFKEGKYTDSDEHMPDYLRVSQAERCLNDKPSNE